MSWNSHGRFTPANVLESHQDAARRWGAEYVCNEKLTCSPFADKALMLREAQGDHVVWLDGDAIVRFDCPNLFDAVPIGVFAGVPNYQGDTHDGDPWRYHEPDWSWCVQKHQRFDLFYSADRLINGGVIVFTPADHWPIWDDEYPAQPNGEQTLMNFRADMLGMERMSLSTSFNRIGPEAWTPGPMRRFIQHLAAFRWESCQRRRSDRDAVLSQIDWRKAA